MKVVKSILLGSVAGLVSVAAAQAADLPSRKAAPVEYVKVCDTYGRGFFYIPGGNTCLKVGGYVRAEYQFTPGRDIRTTAAGGAITQIAGDQDELGMEFRGRVALDARTQTAWGTAQTVVILRGTNTDGIRVAGMTAGWAGFNAASRVPNANGTTAITMERAFIRFAGLTAGLSSSNYTTMPSYMYHSSMAAGFPNGVKQLSYTATFGGGFSASIAIESRGDYNTQSGVANYTYRTTWDSGYVLVGNVRYDQSWGYVQVMGAVSNNSTNTTPTAAPPANALLQTHKTYGAYAIGMGARFNLPMIAAGDHISLFASYTNGMMGLAGCSHMSACSTSSNRRFLGGVQYANVNMIVTDTVAGVHTYSNTKAYSLNGIFTHYWTPSVRSNLSVGYTHVDAPTVTAAALGGAAQRGDASIWGLGLNLIWSPVSGFNMGVEVAYLNNKISVQNAPAAFIAAGSPGLSNDGWSGKIRIERTF